MLMILLSHYLTCHADAGNLLSKDIALPNPSYFLTAKSNKNSRVLRTSPEYLLAPTLHSVKTHFAIAHSNMLTQTIPLPHIAYCTSDSLRNPNPLRERRMKYKEYRQMSAI